MAADTPDLAADLLAALGSVVREETHQTAQEPDPPVAPTESTQSPAPLPVAEPIADPTIAVPTTAAPTIPMPMPMPVMDTATTIAITSAAALPIPAPELEPPPDFRSVPSPKRQRTPVFNEEGDAKRQKKLHDVPNIDMAMLLQNALGSFDEQLNPADVADHILHMNEEEVHEIASEPATPVPAKPEPNLMKVSENPVFMMRSMSLPVLGNLAVQILLRLAQQPPAETMALLADMDTTFRRTYDTLKKVFAPTRTIFSESSLLFSCEQLNITDLEDRETVRMSNLATVGLSIFDTQDVSLKEIHDQFFPIFVPEYSEYTEFLTDLYINLKTQAFLKDRDDESAQGRSDMEFLEHYFPSSFEESLRQRSGEIFLSFAEDKLVSAVRERREALHSVINEQAGSDDAQLAIPEASDAQSLAQSLTGMYPPETFFDDFGGYLQGHMTAIVEYAEKYGVNIPSGEDTVMKDAPDAPEEAEEPAPTDDLAALLQSATAKIAEMTEAPLEEEPDLLSGSDGLGLSKLIEQSLENDISSKDLASLIMENLNEGSDSKIPQLPPGFSMPSYASANGHVNGQPQFQSLAQLTQLHASPYHSYTQSSPQVSTSISEGGDGLPPNQSSPTAVLYERARQAAVAKSSATTRREGLHSTRRPWTPEEEKALMAGLDMVKGPHWSQILSLFGPNGTISDILKDRTQVQLKDKARNLKLFFLKTSSEMPYYLQSVTGELKTRAPSQAARKEAEEKARVNSEEEQARLQGIMTLASGLQNNQPNTRSPIQLSSPMHGRSLTPHTGPAVVGGSPSSHGPANIAPAPAGMTGSPAIKNEPLDHHGVSHGLLQNGPSTSQQFHQGVKQEAHGVPQLQPRIPTPHTPIAQMQMMSQQHQANPQSLAQPGPSPSSQAPSIYPQYRPQLPHLQPQPATPSQPQSLPENTESIQPAQVSTGSAIHDIVSQPEQNQMDSSSQLGQPLAPAQPEDESELQHLHALSYPTMSLSVPAPSEPEHLLLAAEPSGMLSLEDSSDASLLETLRAAMATSEAQVG